MKMRIHSILMGSRANGPGIRNTLWVQGCTLNCPGCFNPGTHDPAGGSQLPIQEVCSRLLDPEFPCDGITISGGEPFQQPDALFGLLKLLRAKSAPPILIFTGYPPEEIMRDPGCRACAELSDALICGPYRQDAGSDYRHFLPSRNQKLILMTDRLRNADFEDLPLREFVIDGSGDLIISGIIS